MDDRSYITGVAFAVSIPVVSLVACVYLAVEEYVYGKYHKLLAKHMAVPKNLTNEELIIKLGQCGLHKEAKAFEKWHGRADRRQILLFFATFIFIIIISNWIV